MHDWVHSFSEITLNSSGKPDPDRYESYLPSLPFRVSEDNFTSSLSALSSRLGIFLEGHGSIESPPFALTTLLCGVKKLEIDITASAGGVDIAIQEEVEVGVNTSDPGEEPNPYPGTALRSIADRFDLIQREQLENTSTGAPDYIPGPHAGGDITSVIRRFADSSVMSFKIGTVRMRETGHSLNPFRNIVYYSKLDLWYVSDSFIFVLARLRNSSGQVGIARTDVFEEPTSSDISVFGAPLRIWESPGTSISGTVTVSEWMPDYH